MKRRGVINAPLSAHLARLGHTDLVVVADAGLPIPAHVPVVDLAIVYGEPRFTTVLDALLDEIVVEQAWISEEAAGRPAEGWIRDRLTAPVDSVAHSDLKAMVSRAGFVVRTGENSAFANVVLRCGVGFDID